MKFSRRNMGCGLVALSLLPALPAYAHREKTTVSDVMWSEADGFLYVTHKFHMHQTEVSLFEAGITHSAKFESLRARAQLALYVQENFKLTNGAGRSIPLEVLGAEVEGRDVWVYQQAELKAAPEGLIVSCNLLRSFIPDQINHVDIKLGGEVSSLAFRGEDGPKNVTL